MAELLMEKSAPLGHEEQPVRRICFVCTGNTCRSPMAEAVANVLLCDGAENALAVHAEAFSRGLYACEGDPISHGALTALQTAGVRPTEGHDYRRHTAKPLTREDADRFDLLVGMTPTHTMELIMRFPEAAERIVCMPVPIADPFGGSDEVYRKCLGEITEGVVRLLGLEKHT